MPPKEGLRLRKQPGSDTPAPVFFCDHKRGDGACPLDFVETGLLTHDDRGIADDLVINDGNDSGAVVRFQRLEKPVGNIGISQIIGVEKLRVVLLVFGKEIPAQRQDGCQVVFGS